MFTFPVFGFDGTGAAGGGGGGAGLSPSFGLTFATGCDALSALFLLEWRCLGTQPTVNTAPEEMAATSSQVEYPKDLKFSFMMNRYVWQ